MGYPKKPVVLVVDDTIANIRILDDLLRGEYTVRVATNGATAPPRHRPFGYHDA